MKTSSLRFRINALVTALVLVFFTLTAMLMLEDIRRQIREEMEATSRVTMQLLSTVVYSTQFVPTAISRAEMVRGFLDSVGRIRAHDVVMYGDGETQLYKSPPSLYKQGRQAPAWFTDLVGPETRVLRLSAPGLRLDRRPAHAGSPCAGPCGAGRGRAGEYRVAVRYPQLPLGAAGAGRGHLPAAGKRLRGAR